MLVATMLTAGAAGCSRHEPPAPASGMPALSASPASPAAEPGTSGPAAAAVPSTTAAGSRKPAQPTTAAPTASAAAAPAKAAPAAAAAFARAWVNGNLSAAQWHAAISPLCVQSFADQLATTDPGNLPASRVTGPPRVLQAPAGRSARYTVATNGGVLTVILTALDGRWLVAGNDFAVQ